MEKEGEWGKEDGEAMPFHTWTLPVTTAFCEVLSLNYFRFHLNGIKFKTKFA